MAWIVREAMAWIRASRIGRTPRALQQRRTSGCSCKSIERDRAVDRLNYALHIVAGVNVTVLNSLELLDRQNDTIVACSKIMSALPASVLSTMLIVVPYVPDEKVALIRPDTLKIVYVHRKHIVDCELGRWDTNPADILKDPQFTLPRPSALPHIIFSAMASLMNGFVSVSCVSVASAYPSSSDHGDERALV
ncbi:hypothetical protein PHYPSEUDO_007267 [Phytophthora pseudosyringae]|uniref:Uncharacterized protein n=1 Tax=Phytophthora pseudosyringae TaxID=221518 RepID=A0A8T1VJJ6_9STRA|nr:hypothetical protein PHYPSEUDO_007267 [Phytophthora pseudosyringae]